MLNKLRREHSLEHTNLMALQDANNESKFVTEQEKQDQIAFMETQVESMKITDDNAMQIAIDRQTLLTRDTQQRALADQIRGQADDRVAIEEFLAKKGLPSLGTNPDKKALSVLNRVAKDGKWGSNPISAAENKQTYGMPQQGFTPMESRVLTELTTLKAKILGANNGRVDPAKINNDINTAFAVLMESKPSLSLDSNKVTNGLLDVPSKDLLLTVPDDEIVGLMDSAADWDDPSMLNKLQSIKRFIIEQNKANPQTARDPIPSKGIIATEVVRILQKVMDAKAKYGGFDELNIPRITSLKYKSDIIKPGMLDYITTPVFSPNALDLLGKPPAHLDVLTVPTINILQNKGLL